MKRVALLAAVLSLGLLPYVLAESEDAGERKADDKAEKQKAVMTGRVIGHLETRGHLITIKAGDNDKPLFSIKTRDGEVVVTDLTAAEIQARHPGVFTILEHGLAGGAGIKGATLLAN